MTPPSELTMGEPHDHYRSVGRLPEGNRVERLVSPHPQFRASAAWAIAVSCFDGGDPDQDPQDVLKIVLGKEWSTLSPERREALIAPLVRTLLEDKSPLVIEIAAAALATQGIDGLTALLDHIAHPDARVRNKIAIAACLLDESAQWILPSLLRAATIERVALVRGDLVRAISRIDDPELFGTLLQLTELGDDSPEDIGEEIISALRERRRREWPEANGLRPRTLRDSE